MWSREHYHGPTGRNPNISDPVSDDMSVRPDENTFPYRLDGRWTALFKMLGVNDHDGVVLTEDDRLVVTYGRFRVETPLANVSGTGVTGPHRWWTAVGVRLSLADDGLTFGTNHHRGLCIEFAEPVPRVMGFRKHSSLWVSVADPEALAAALAGV